MKIEHEFTVDAPIDVAWTLLTDIPAIAVCMPGATLTGVDPGDDGAEVYRGKVKVKIGPVVSEYKGTASFISKDEDSRQAVIDAKGRDSRGAGNAAATIKLGMRSNGEQTRVSVDTELKISGKIAQFGSSMIREVSEKLLGQFVDCLEGKLRPADVSEDVVAEEVLPEVPVAEQPLHQPLDQPVPVPVTAEAEPLDLLDLAGSAAAKRAVPIVVAVLAAVAIIVYIRRR